MLLQLHDVAVAASAPVAVTAVLLCFCVVAVAGPLLFCSGWLRLLARLLAVDAAIVCWC